MSLIQIETEILVAKINDFRALLTIFNNNSKQ